MSTSKIPSDNNMQLPSLDELEPSDETETNDFEQEQDEEPCGARNFCPALPPHDEAGPSQSGDSQEQRHLIPPDVRHDQNSRSSLYDQLPNSLGESSGNPQGIPQLIGPALPPGFLLNGDNEDGEDPEDPGDPEDPDGSSLYLAGSSRKSAFSSGLPEETRREIGPTLPPSFVQAPSLPDEEIRSYTGGPSSSTAPPPEPSIPYPENLRKRTPPGWVRENGYLVDPGFPDLVPVMPRHEVDEPTGVRENEESEDEMYGPAVPAELNLEQGPGPSQSNRAANVEVPTEGDDEQPNEEEDEDEEDDDDIFGPMPPEDKQSDAEEREYSVRLAQFNAHVKQLKSNVSRREEWMLEPPKKLPNFGLGPRSFSKKSGNVSDDHGSREWTETPADKARRLMGSGDEAGPSGLNSWENRRNAERDAAQENQAAELNKNRNQSLLEMHQRKRKTEDGETEEERKLRQPFDRERDMEVRGLRGDADVAKVKERMGQLSSRFASSSSKKYL